MLGISFVVYQHYLIFYLNFRTAGGKLVDASPELEKDMKNELDRVRRVYGGGEGVDMTKFPTFTFPEPKVDPINTA